MSDCVYKTNSDGTVKEISQSKFEELIKSKPKSFLQLSNDKDGYYFYKDSTWYPKKPNPDSIFESRFLFFYKHLIFIFLI